MIIIQRLHGWLCPKAAWLKSIGILGVLVGGLFHASSLKAQLKINEILASNVKNLLDEDGDSSDWVELINTGASPLDTAGYFISDDDEHLKRWALPQIIIPPGEYLLLWCSGKDKSGAPVDPPPPPVSGGASSHWPLAEGAGESFENLVDGELDGFLEGATVNWVDVTPDQGDSVPPQDSAVEFSGAGSRIQTNYEGVSGSKARTITCWIRTTTIGTGGFVSWGNSAVNGAKWHFRLNPTAANGTVGALRTEVQGGQNVATTVLTDGQWHHVACVFPEGASGVSDVLHFVDGELDPRSGGTNVAIDTQVGGVNNQVLIGSRNQGGVLHDYAGSIADVRIYDRELSLEDIQAIFNGGDPEDPPEGPEVAEGFHTNFQLSAGGETLFLVHPNGQIEDEIEYPNQVSDQSYGRSPDGSGNFLFHLNPSPLKENTGTTSPGPLVVADTNFEPNRGFFSDPIQVAITTETQDATIRYTLDGTLPSETHGEVYTGPLSVSDTTVIRAAAFKDGLRSTNADAHTYIYLETPEGGGILNQSARPSGWPLSWGTRSADYAMDQRVVSDEGSPYFDKNVRDGLLAHPSISIAMPLDDLFHPTTGIYTNSLAHGDQWERACSFEIIHPDGEDGVQVNAGLRLMGNASRQPTRPKHNMRVAFRRSYGPSRLRYQVFKDTDVDEFDTIVLRGGNGDSWFHPNATQRQRAQYIRDQWHRDVEKAMKRPTTHQAYYHLYINGLYWGLYHVFERPNGEFLSSHFGGDEDDWDAINGGDVIDGNLTAYNRLLSLAQRGVSTPEAYQGIQEFLDVDNLIDFLLINFYSGNVDWDTKNWYGGRRRVDGAGYMFFCWDAERTFWNIGENRTGLNIAGKPSSIHQRLRANEEYRMRFADRTQRHLFNQGSLSPEGAAKLWQDRADEIRVDLAAESARWGDDDRFQPYSVDTEWTNELNFIMNSWFPRRGGILLTQLKSQRLYPNVEAPQFNQHGGFIDEGFRLKITAPLGDIYYTLNGEDPRLEGGAISEDAIVIGGIDETILLPEDSDLRYLVPTSDAEGLSWIQPNFDDAPWAQGKNGIGLEASSGYQSLIQTDVLEEMHDKNASVYMRYRFDVKDPKLISTLNLRMKYDDGFVAYLNGELIAAKNAPEELTWNASATAGHSDSLAKIFEKIEITEHLPKLVAGENVLAIHGMNVTQGSNDALFVALLSGAEGIDDNSIPLNSTTHVQARAFHDGEWSALVETTFIHFPLRVTELHYHPASEGEGNEFDSEDFEFIEIANVGPKALDLSDVQISGDIRFDFSSSDIKSLLPNQRLIVVEDKDAFELRYGLEGRNVAGQYRGNLSNGGGEILITGKFQETIQQFSYSDDWYESTDGPGHSLEIKDPLGDLALWSTKEGWKASEELHGTPGISEGSEGGLRIPGDGNSSGVLELGDAIKLLTLLFIGQGELPPCEGLVSSEANVALLDTNGDQRLDTSDAIHTLVYLFIGGEPPALGTECRPFIGCPEICNR